MELSNLPHMNSADELPASTEGKDVAGTGWLWELKVRASLKGDAVFKPSDPFDFHFHHIFGAHGTYA